MLSTGRGCCVQDIMISGDADVGDTADWVPDGFVRANNQVRQDWIVWVIVDGPENLVVEDEPDLGRRIGTGCGVGTSGQRV